MMHGSLETLSTLAFALLALTLPAASTSRQCRAAGARPHPDGFCGRDLAQLHQNFCVMLRMQYPEIFARSRRSAGRQSTLPARAVTLNIPLAVLARLDLQQFGASPSLRRPEDEPLALATYGDLDRAEFEGMTFPGLIHVLRKRSARQKRDLVCDCCYNACSRDRLAMYC